MTTTPALTSQMDALRVIIDNGEIKTYEPLGKIEAATPSEVTLALTTLVLFDLNTDGDVTLDVVLRAQRAVLANEDVDIKTDKGIVVLRPSIGEVWIVRRSSVRRYVTMPHLGLDAEGVHLAKAAA